MLPIEQTLLSELRRRASWNHFARRKKLDGLVQSDEARLLLRAIDLIHSKGNGAVAGKTELKRVITSIAGQRSGEVKRAADLLGDPSSDELSISIVWNAIAGNQLAKQHDLLLKQATAGRLENGNIRELVKQWRELEALESNGKAHGSIKSIREPLPVPEHGGERLPTGLHVGLDTEIGGGLRRGELAVIVAPSKHGKTTSLLRTACHLARSKKRVVYLSFEIYLEQIVQRVTQLVGGKRHLPSTLFAAWLPAARFDVESVIGLADEVGSIDCLMIDYIELLRLDSFDMVNSVGEALLKLRNYARERDAVVWTASQSDEPRPGQAYLTRDEIYGSRRKIHHADLVIGTLSNPARRQLSYSIWGSRHGQMGARYLSEADLVNLTFRDL